MTSWPAANGVRWVKPSIARESPSWTTTATPSASDTISAIGQQVPLDLAVADGLGPAVGRVVDGGELRGGAHGGVDLPVPVVAADSLDDLEEQPVAEHAGVEVEQLAAGLVAVVQDAAEGGDVEGEADPAAGAGQGTAAHEAGGGRVLDAAARPEPEEQLVEEP